jgi:dihydrofolate synthase/folylpolyglutamate synthase
MSYNETLDYLYQQLPMFHRIGAAAYKANLDNTHAILDVLHHPEKFLEKKSVHIAGTNGKGSTSHMLAAILQTAGFKTGLYTSPHLKDFRERIRINGKMISENAVIRFVENRKEEFEKIQPSFFEWTVGCAFDFFASEKVDVAIIETGLGGRLDSTNVITPALSVITNISWDHMQLLGDSLEKIAAEKAGIIKKDIPVVIGETQETVKNIFIQKAQETEATIVFADDQLTLTMDSEEKQSSFFTVNIFQNNKLIFSKLQLDLTGTYQLKNILTVIQSVQQLRTKGFKISDEHVYTALRNVKGLTGLMGRWQTLSENPLTICDVGHNEDGMQYVTEQISETKYNHLHFVLGVVSDKDISGILKLLPKNATYYFCKAAIPRAMPADELQEQAVAFQLHGETYDSVQAAFHAAQSKAQKDDLIFIGGSTFVVAEVL